MDLNARQDRFNHWSEVGDGSAFVFVVMLSVEGGGHRQ